MSNAQKKREAAERHNKAFEESKRPVKRVLTSGKLKTVHTAMMMFGAIGMGRSRAVPKTAKKTLVIEGLDNI